MGDPAQIKITVQAAKWSDASASWLARALQHASVEELRHQVAHGAVLFDVLVDGAQCGAVVLRIDHTADGPEGVIVAAAAEVRGVDLVAAVLPSLEFQFSGVRAIRVHTARRGLVKKLSQCGYEPSEIVLRKSVK